jgi:hypothetical protein
MPDKQNQGPQCAACGSPMKFSAIEPSYTGRDLRTFVCPKCARIQRHIIESALTQPRLDPERAIDVGRGNAVTYEIHYGCMIPKPAKSKADSLTAAMAAGGCTSRRIGSGLE